MGKELVGHSARDRRKAARIVYTGRKRHCPALANTGCQLPVDSLVDSVHSMAGLSHADSSVLWALCLAAGAAAVVATAARAGGTTVSTAEPSTSIHSINPDVEQYTMRSQWLMSTILNNCTNRTPKELWDSIKMSYGSPTVVGRLAAEARLAACKFVNFLSEEDPTTAYCQAKALVYQEALNQRGADQFVFEFIPIFALVLSAPTRMDAENHILTFKGVVDHVTVGGTQAGPTNATTATVTPVWCGNCKRRGHKHNDCWAPGSGKEGQAPPWWGKRGGGRWGGRGAQADTTSGNNTTANAVYTGVFALSAVTCFPQRVPVDNPLLYFPEAHPIEFIAEDASPPCIINAATAPPLRYKTVSGAMPISLDSGASDNCFVSRKDVVSYQPTFRQGQAALDKDGYFKCHRLPFGPIVFVAIAFLVPSLALAALPCSHRLNSGLGLWIPLNFFPQRIPPSCMDILCFGAFNVCAKAAATHDHPHTPARGYCPASTSFIEVKTILMDRHSRRDKSH
ncbi:hypothetical protein B0H13DRAFT_1870793 [Mycena leptocephala]|nr:hypothetical protein B0H13DRAFT_1870793 [Mycena leptocephala]